MWTSTLRDAADNGMLSATLDTDAAARLSNETNLTWSLALDIEAFSGRVTGFGVDKSIGPLVQVPSIDIVSGNLATLFSQDFDLGGFDCTINCDPVFFLNISALETVECSGCGGDWGNPLRWENGEVGGSPAVAGRAVNIHPKPSGILYIPSGDSHTVGSFANENELHVRGTLIQEDGDASTTFSNSHRLFVMNGGELEIHAPITGGFRGPTSLVLGGGTLRGRVDINS